jgi:hypothetical protein
MCDPPRATAGLGEGSGDAHDDGGGSARRRIAGVRRSERKSGLRSTLTRAEGIGVHAGTHQGLGLAGARVQGDRRR